MALLEVKGLHAAYGQTRVLHGIDFAMEQGSITALLGANGAGKTTLFNCISRLYPCERGDIAFAGRSLLRLPRHRIAAIGIGRTFQAPALFASMTVLDNVMVGHHCRTRGGFFANALRLAYAVQSDRGAERRARALLAMLGLEAVAASRVSELPFGTQKRVELARALGDAAPEVERHHPVRDAHHEVHVVLDEQHGDPEV